MNIIPTSFIVSKTLKLLEGLERGSLKLTTPEGKVHQFQGKQPGPNADIRVHDWVVARNVLVRGDIAMGEDYIAGLWDSDSIEALFTLFLLNMETFEPSHAHGSVLSRIGFLIYNRIVCRNSKKGSRQNIEAHYDVGNDFYKLWLDETMTYSSALYDGTDCLVQAQKNKYGRILERLSTDAKSLLEIGCGWGGFAEQAAGQERHVTGLTISPSQHKFATDRLGEKADIRLQDYRDTGGLFDAIVSIEMFEAVGERYWPIYFKTVSERLKRGGKAVIQTITMGDEFFEGYRQRSDFIRHYVFPGGMLPSPTRFKEEAAKAGLKCTDSFSFGKDYARTLATWLERFDAKKAEIKAMGYSEEFIRNWRFYLSICAATFASARTDVIQMELQHA